MRIHSHVRRDESQVDYIAYRSVETRDGREEHYARDFRQTGGALDNLPLDPVGEFHLVASPSGVEIRRATVRTEEQLDTLVHAMDEAWTSHLAYLALEGEEGGRTTENTEETE